MAKTREVLCKQYASTEKNIEGPNYFMAFLQASVIALTIHVRILTVAQCRYLPLIKGYSQHYKICTLLKMEPRREIKLSGSNEYLCFETNISRKCMIHAVDFILTWHFFV